MKKRFDYVEHFFSGNFLLVQQARKEPEYKVFSLEKIDCFKIIEGRYNWKEIEIDFRPRDKND
jgi:hypothetical protein